VSNNSTVDLKSDGDVTPSYAQTLMTKKTAETTELKTIFTVASWD